ncbi:MAG: DUF1553 domain-containing protein [Bryobacteraceae bacterium]
MKNLLLLLGAALPLSASGDAVVFNRDVRPIFSDKCYTCHGPDKANRKTNLRFDVEADAMANLGKHFAIVPGDPSRSEMIRRVTTDNKALRMPPVYTGVKLTDREIDVLRRWVEQGAKWQKNWSLIPPVRAAYPNLKNREWAKNGIDYFVLDRLEREGWKPSPEADRPTLIRRVSLDLTGLPPTPAEVDAFLKDTSPDAYEKVVDRLLASPRYGERMAVRWLDAARYADTSGYQNDGERDMWRWRDWVIDAWNSNMPFDQFTVEQIAGDLLPHPKPSQRIATGFNRNHRGNSEGGIVPEEYAVEYVVDRVDATSTVWLGLTMGCARCHDHKYDPLKQKEFYQMFAYFNNIPEKGRALKFGNSPPVFPAPTPAQQAMLNDLDDRTRTAEKRYTSIAGDLEKAQRAWEKDARKRGVPGWTLERELLAHYALDGSLAGRAADPLTGKDVPAKFLNGEAEYGPGSKGKAASFDGKRYIDAGNVGDFGYFDKFTMSAWIYPTASDGAILTRTLDSPDGGGYGLHLKQGKLLLNLVARFLDDSLRLETERGLELNRWHHVTATYDGSREAKGVRLYIDGENQKLKVIIDELNQSFDSKEPLRIGGGGGPENRFQGRIADVRLYHVPLTAAEAAVLATPASIGEIAAIEPAKRTTGQAEKIERYFLEKEAPAAVREAWQQVTDLRRARKQLLESLPTVMVMEESPKPRDTFLLLRGAYDKPGEKVMPGVPSALPPLPEGAPNNRLGFARWLVDPANPLTARVTVNRFWQMFFGAGLVKTVEDFGSQGEWPSNPELLDWVATEFIGNKWNVKGIVKTIVMSATYQQSSRVTPELIQKDPENRLLARGPRFRLPAEMVRDQALAVSGLLVEKTGGPSVRPYQPAGLWRELSNGGEYQPDTGDGLYRRTMYTFWKRTVSPPAMLTFDSALRETCTVRESRTNTPLQALTLMNNVTYVETSRNLAQRMMIEGGRAPAERIAYGFRLATAREPGEKKGRILLDSFHHYLDRYQTDRAAAEKLVSEGDSPRKKDLNVSELAAYTTVASLILNLDETVTKE